MAEESLKVAVRVRPFNQREKDRGAKLIIQMPDSTKTIITNPENESEQKSFSFDYSYWSHDGFVERDGVMLADGGSNSKYASQYQVFDQLGRGVLKNAFDGYNCSLFAYGQTGSGKSYSMVGYGANKGIVPITCDEMFKVVSQNTDKDKRFEVTLSMLEIYNEIVRDLLSAECPKGGLPVRQSPNSGFYVQGLKKVPVGSYKEIEKRMEQGTSNRTVASTNMNATSSRAHTVVSIAFDQLVKGGVDGETRKSSTMNLVDLAGSERAESTGATGDRLKEGANINRSLSALGNVISALADIASGKKKVLVPYRDSVLTKLLQNALGGNSKTIMIAALSPADINYDETLSTLRYADRAKKIKNTAVVNENATEKMIRELKEENERLKVQLSSGSEVLPLPATVVTTGMTDAELERMREELRDEMRAQMNENTERLEIVQENAQNYQEKLKEARAEVAQLEQKQVAAKDRKKSTPHLVNLNEDPQLCGMIVHLLESRRILVEKAMQQRDVLDEADEEDELEEVEEEDDVMMEDAAGEEAEEKAAKKKKDKKKRDKEKKKQNGASNKAASGTVTISLQGLSISRRHAVITVSEDLKKVEIRPGTDGAKTLLNGMQLKIATQLHHKDRLLFGSNHMYVFMNPRAPDTDPELPRHITWEFSQKEIAEVKGYQTSSGYGLTKDQLMAQQQILEILPLVSEVNAISEELNKQRSFELMLASPSAQEGIYGQAKVTKVLVKMTNLLNWNFWLWERGKFMNRRFLMQEMYQQYLDGHDVSRMAIESDPFWERSEMVLIGTASVFLTSLGYNFDFEDQLPICDYSGNRQGVVQVCLYPCESHGKPLGEDHFVENPRELLGRMFHFTVCVKKLELFNTEYMTHGVQVRYRVFKDERFVETQILQNDSAVSPQSRMVDFNHKKIFTFSRIHDDHLNFFEKYCITFGILTAQTDDRTMNGESSSHFRKRSGEPDLESEMFFDMWLNDDSISRVGTHTEQMFKSISDRRMSMLNSEMEAAAASVAAGATGGGAAAMSGPDSRQQFEKTALHMQHQQFAVGGMVVGDGAMNLERNEELSQLRAELATTLRKNLRLERKEQELKNILEEWKKKPEEEKIYDKFYSTVQKVLTKKSFSFKSVVQQVSSLILLDKLRKATASFERDQNTGFNQLQHQQTTDSSGSGGTTSSSGLRVPLSVGNGGAAHANTFSSSSLSARAAGDAHSYPGLQRIQTADSAVPPPLLPHHHQPHQNFTINSDERDYLAATAASSNQRQQQRPRTTGARPATSGGGPGNNKASRAHAHNSANDSKVCAIM